MQFYTGLGVHYRIDTGALWGNHITYDSDATYVIRMAILLEKAGSEVSGFGAVGAAFRDTLSRYMGQSKCCYKATGVQCSSSIVGYPASLLRSGLRGFCIFSQCCSRCKAL